MGSGEASGEAVGTRMGRRDSGARGRDADARRRHACASGSVIAALRAPAGAPAHTPWTCAGAQVEVVRSSRKTLGLQVKDPGCVVVRAPRRVSEAAIRRFLAQHEDWVAAALKRVEESRRAREEAVAQEGLLGQEDLAVLAMQAREAIPARVAYFAPRIGVGYGRITLRCQKTRWGSCTAKGNLNFNVLLMLAPPEVLDYVVIHELCHRLEMNHSPRFWALVAQHDPAFKEHKAWLRAHGSALLARAGKYE